MTELERRESEAVNSTGNESPGFPRLRAVGHLRILALDELVQAVKLSLPPKRLAVLVDPALEALVDLGLHLFEGLCVHLLTVLVDKELCQLAPGQLCLHSVSVELA